MPSQEHDPADPFRRRRRLVRSQRRGRHRDQIRGQFELNGANHPKLTINRQSGLISLDGLTKFKGSRDPIDDRDHRRF